MPVIAIIVLVLGILLILAGLYLIKSNKDKAEKIGNAEEKARNIIDEALKAAETKKREGLLELKEETLRNKNELERESKERRAELQKFEKRVLAKEEALDRKGDSLEKRESQLASREDKLNKRQAEVDALSEKRVQELERISGLTSEQAKDYLLKTVEDEVKHETAMLVKELKEETLRNKNELERESKERRAELQKFEKRVLAKEEALDRKGDSLEKRESQLASREDKLNKRQAEVDALSEKRVQELERISGLTSEQAKDYLLKTVEDEVKHETAMLVKELETRAKEEAGKKAKEYVVTAIQKCAADHVAETTISVVPLPNDEMKGRIIGREGRNIRTLETMTGVDLIIDDTPEAVILSSFDPIRREVARIALEKLIVDGRIHPARIEEMVEKAQKEVETMIREEGEAATLEVGVHGIHPELVRLLGKMKFRTSYGQNALKHSIEVAQLSGLLAAEIGVDVRMAKRAGLLHDIGKSVDHEMEGSHIQIGVDLCKKYKESPIVINAVESHHGDVEPTSLIACIVQAADTISAARPGARRETLETYTNRLNQLEDITNSFKGVEKSFAIQAGREIRVMVVPEQVSDADMILLARDIAKQIEAELEYPGQIKVNVIRESRVMEYAK